MARSKHSKVTPKPIKPAQTTSQTTSKKIKIKIEGASQATPAQQVPDWQETPDCKITKLKLCCDGSCPIGAEGQPYTTADKSNFKRHMANWHQEEDYGPNIRVFPVMPGGCTVCNAGFKTKQGLLRHHGGKFCSATGSFKVKVVCNTVAWCRSTTTGGGLKWPQLASRSSTCWCPTPRAIASLAGEPKTTTSSRT